MANAPEATPAVGEEKPRGFLGWIERVGNKLPDPAILFVWGLALVWILSWLLSLADVQTVHPVSKDTVLIQNQLEGSALVQFLKDLVKTFTGFHPLGVVLVALLGVGVAEASGFINAGLKGMLSFTPKALLTPMLILVAIVSHTAADAGYVLVIPLGGVIFYAAGRHPLAGITAAFAGVSGGFSANFIVGPIDPLLQGLSQASTSVYLGEGQTVAMNPLCNYYFTAISSVLVVAVGWLLTDLVIEPRLRRTAKVDGDPEDMPKMEPMTPLERRGLRWGGISMLIGVGILILVAIPEDSILRLNGELTNPRAPMMGIIVPLIFLLFLIPGIVHGYVSRTFKSSKDIIGAMSKSMQTMGYYLVMAFFASLFLYSFGKSNIGLFLAIEGAAFLQEAGFGTGVNVVGIILLTAFVNLLVGSASAKWALLSPIFIPMLMALGISPDFTQAAYRVGDSTTNIITPLMPYFPLVVVFCQRYVKKSGIGTVTSLMLPYSICLLILWTIFLIIYWQIGIPLGVDASYTHPR